LTDFFQCISPCRTASVEAWSHLAQATLARLVMFNKRRGGEASKMLSDDATSKND